MCFCKKTGEGHKKSCISRHTHQALRIAFWVLLVLGFSVAVGAGVETARFVSLRRQAMAYAKAGYHVQPTYSGFKIFKRVQVVRPEPLPEPIMIYGKVLKVDGARITILTNAATEQIVISRAETTIMIGDKEYGISNVEAGDEGTFGGFMTKQNQLEAKVIELK